MLEDLIHKTIQDHYEELIEFPGFAKQLMQIIQQPEAMTTFNQEDWKIAATLLAVKYSRHNNLDFNETFLEQKLLEAPQRHAFLILQTFLDIFEKYNKITESRYSYISSKREPTYIENFIKNKDITLSQDATKSILIQLNNTYKTDSVFALVINSKNFSDQNIMDILLSDDNLKFDIVDKIIKYKTSISNPIQQEIIQVILEQQNSVHDFHDKQNLNKLLTSILQNKSFDDSLIELLMTKSGLHYIRQYSSKTLQDIFASHNFSFECLKQIISANSNTINFIIQTQKLTDQQFQIMLDKYPQFWHEAVTNTNISQKLALKFFNDTIQKPHLLGALLKVNGEKIPNKLLLDTASSLMQNTTFNVATTNICLHLIAHNDNDQQLFDKIYPIIKTINNPPTMAHLFLNNNTTTEQRKTIIKEYPLALSSSIVDSYFVNYRTDRKPTSYGTRNITTYSMKDTSEINLSNEILNLAFPVLSMNVQKALLKDWSQKLELSTLLLATNSRSSTIRHSLEDIIQEKPEFKEYIKNLGFVSLNSQNANTIIQKAYRHFIKNTKSNAIEIS